MSVDMEWIGAMNGIRKASGLPLITDEDIKTIEEDQKNAGVEDGE